MRTLCIAATCVLLAAPAARAGSIVDSFLGGSGLNIGECNTDHCSFSVGKQKHVVRRSDFGSAAVSGMETGDKLVGAAKSQLRSHVKGSDAASSSERTAPAKPQLDRSEERPAARRDEIAASSPAKKDTKTKDIPAEDVVVLPAKDTVASKAIVPVAENPEAAPAAPAPSVADPAASNDPKSPIGEWITE
ncbi:MAG: hypothetical protein JO228_05585, partial [Xanthobacteraceae bacterium]|nr:hypothetical protein [Xanthobacteraceae bacterium]